MVRFYYICEKRRSGKAKFLTVLNGKAAALSGLKRYASQTLNGVYIQDVLSKQVIARRNA
jgi:hypothetical protein